MAISSIGALGNLGNRTVGSLGGDANSQIQDLVSSLQAGSGGANLGGAGAGGGGCSCGCKGGGCCGGASSASNRAQGIGGI